MSLHEQFEVCRATSDTTVKISALIRSNVEKKNEKVVRIAINITTFRSNCPDQSLYRML